MTRSLALLALTLPAPLAAQSPQEAAAQNMQLAAELCLRNHRTESEISASFRRGRLLGVTLHPGDVGRANTSTSCTDVDLLLSRFIRTSSPALVA